jgi:hypothetical protein
MNYLLYRVPEHLVIHYGILMIIVTVFVPIFFLDRDLTSYVFFNNFIIFDVLYYILFEKLNFTNED